MAPRTKLCKNRAPGTEERLEKSKISGWERSKISAQDNRLLKKMGLFNKKTMKMPGDESSPQPPSGFRPLQARKNPLWLYSGAEDVDRVSDDLPLKDLEKLVRRFTSLSKNNEVPSSCCVEPFSSDHTLPDNHQSLSSLPPLPEGGDVDERVIVNDDSQESSIPENDPAESQKSAGSSNKDSKSEQPSDSAHSVSPPPAASPDKRKRKRNADEDSGTSKLSEPAAKESSPEEQEVFDLYTATGAVSSDDEEDLEPEAHGPANTSTTNTLVLSEDHRVVPETSPPAHVDPKASSPTPSPRAPKKKRARTGAAGKQELAAGSISTPLLDDPLMKEMIDLDSRFIGLRDEAESLREALRRAEEHANDLEEKLRASEEAREKAEKDATGVEDLRRRLQAAEDALSDKEAKLVQHDNNIITRLETQSRRFSRKMGEHYTLNQESDEDRVMDTLTILELNCDLARKCLTSARNALKCIFPHFFPKITQPEIFAQLAQQFLAKDDPALAYRQASLKIGVEGTIALVAASDQKVDWVMAATAKGLNTDKWKALVKDAKLYSKKLIAFLDLKSSASASTAQTEVK
ncbi:hypothetical protein ACQ4PT_045759 [Festuca glaucescens]